MGKSGVKGGRDWLGRGGYQMVDSDDEEMRGSAEDGLKTGGIGAEGEEAGRLGGLVALIRERSAIVAEKVDKDGILREYAKETFSPSHLKMGHSSLNHWSSPLIKILVLCLIVLLSVMYMLPSLAGNRRAFRSDSRNGLLHDPGVCAEASDLFNPSNEQCRVSNGMAYGALAMQEWVSCNMQSQAVPLLRAGMDGEGRFWYPYQEARPVRNFYRSCVRKCAATQDTYDEVSKVCVVHDQKALEWLQSCPPGGGKRCTSSQGRGLVCSLGAAAGVIQKGEVQASDVSGRGEANGFTYAVARAGDVGRMYESCEHLCNEGDMLRRGDGDMCVVSSPGMVRFLQGGGGQCDLRSMGYKAIRAIAAQGRDRGRAEGSFGYGVSDRGVVEAFYATCKGL